MGGAVKRSTSILNSHHVSALERAALISATEQFCEIGHPSSLGTSYLGLSASTRLTTSAVSIASVYGFNDGGERCALAWRYCFLRGGAHNASERLHPSSQKTICGRSSLTRRSRGIVRLYGILAWAHCRHGRAGSPSGAALRFRLLAVPPRAGCCDFLGPWSAAGVAFGKRSATGRRDLGCIWAIRSAHGYSPLTGVAQI